MKRVRKWDKVWREWLEENRQRPFEWGQWDCGLMAAENMRILTGEDPAEDLRGTYSSAKGAMEAIENRGGFEAVGDARFGERIPLAKAQRGDIVLARCEHGLTYLVAAGVNFYGPGQHGIEPVRREDAEPVCAWRIG